MSPDEKKIRRVVVNATEFEDWCILQGGDGKTAESELLLKYLAEKGTNLDTDKVIFVMDDKENEACDITERLRHLSDASSLSRLRRVMRGQKNHNPYMKLHDEDCCCDSCRGKRARMNQEIAKMTVNPPARNAPCPCGSGKKFKQCCHKKKTQALIDRALANK